MEKDLNKLLSSFKILSHLSSHVALFIQIHNTFSENYVYLNKFKLKGQYSYIPLTNAASGSLFTYSIIICNSFFDEYNKEFTAKKHPLYADRIMKLKKHTKPILNRLKKWPHLKNYRDNILAHNLRIKEISIFDPEIDKKKYKIPFTDSENILLIQMTRMICHLIRLEFPELILDRSETITSKTDVESSHIDVDSEVNHLWKQIESIQATLLNTLSSPV